MAKITPITIPTKGIATNLNLVVLNFSMEDTTATFYYTLTKDFNYGENSNNVLLEGNIQMTEEEFSQWGTDNNYCLLWAANKLGLTIIN
jgi:hypothetical protein